MQDCHVPEIGTLGHDDIAMLRSMITDVPIARARQPQQCHLCAARVGGLQHRYESPRQVLVEQQRAMAQEAEALREKRARIIKADGELAVLPCVSEP